MIKFTKMVEILFIGVLSSVIVFAIVYSVFASILQSTSILEYEDQFIVILIIIMGMLFLSVIISSILSIIIVEKKYNQLVKSAAFYSFVILLILLIGVSYTAVILQYPNFWLSLTFLDKIFFPGMFVYFSVYILESPVVLIFLIIVIYYLLFITILEYLSTGSKYDPYG